MNIKEAKKYYCFALKSGSVVFGTDNILKAKRAFLILIKSSLSLNAKQKIESKAKGFNCYCEELDDKNFLEIEQNQSVKAIAITDENIAKAMIKF